MAVSRQVIIHEGPGGSFESMWVGDAHGGAKPGILLFPNILGTKEWDFASWSESTKDSAVMGTVDECVEQLKAHVAVGTQKIIFVPYKYEAEQIELIAREIIPRLKAK